jgi:2-iminobutanoate/2-iminopropanoate deaminase
MIQQSIQHSIGRDIGSDVGRDVGRDKMPSCIVRSHEVHPMPPDEIEVLAPSGAIKPTGPWSLGIRAGDFVFVAGMRGIDPATNRLVDGEAARVRQAFSNMKTIVEAAGGSLRDAVRLVVYVTDMDRHRLLVNRIQEELWRDGPYPPRSIVEVSRLNQDDIVEVEGTFFCPLRKAD